MISKILLTSAVFIACNIANVLLAQEVGPEDTPKEQRLTVNNTLFELCQVPESAKKEQEQLERLAEIRDPNKSVEGFMSFAKKALDPERYHYAGYKMFGQEGSNLHSSAVDLQMCLAKDVDLQPDEREEIEKQIKLLMDHAQKLGVIENAVSQFRDETARSGIIHRIPEAAEIFPQLGTPHYDEYLFYRIQNLAQKVYLSSSCIKDLVDFYLAFTGTPEELNKFAEILGKESIEIGCREFSEERGFSIIGSNSLPLQQRYNKMKEQGIIR